MDKLKKTVEQKLGDHQNVNEDPDVDPKSGTGIGANQGTDEGKSWVENRIQAGQGSGDPDEGPKAGSTTSADTKPSGEASKAIGDTK